jgi:transcriptional regulator with XRE-family HTH domain
MTKERKWTFQIEFCPHCHKRIRPTAAEIKETRQLLGMTQRQFAAELKCNFSTIAYVETGQRNMGPDLTEHYWQMVRRLNVRLSKKRTAAQETAKRLIDIGQAPK